MAKLYIATPMFGGLCHGFYAQALLSLNNILRDHKIDSMISFMFNESLITRALICSLLTQTSNSILKTFLGC
jgi:hypothetical protein